MHRVAIGVRIEWCAAVVAELERELLIVGDDFLDARLAQQRFDFADDLGRFVLGAEQRPDDAVEDGVVVARAEADAVFLKALVVKAEMTARNDSAGLPSVVCRKATEARSE